MSPTFLSEELNEKQVMRHSDPRSRFSIGIRILRSLVAFVALFAIVISARNTGFLTGYWMLALAGIGLMLIPTARLLSQRILFSGLIALGLVGLIWWIPQDLLGTDHGTFVLAGLFGSIAAWVAGAHRPRIRIRRLLPVVRWVDSLPLLAGLLSAWSLKTFLAVRHADQALSIMSTHWDFQSHFGMYYMLRTRGSVIPIIPAPSTGGAWAFTEYPQGFHAVVATLAELVNPKAMGINAELITYINIQAVVCVLTVILLAAAFCSLRSFRHRSIYLSPVFSVAMAAWILGPGSTPIFDGFANFYLGCGIVAATILTIVNFGRKIPLVGVAAVGAGIVGACNNWFLLASLFAIITLATLVNLIRDRDLYKRRWWISAAVVSALTILGISLPVLQLLPVLGRAQDVVSATGGIVPPDFGMAIAIICLAVALGFVNLSIPSRTRLAGMVRKRIGIACVGLLLPVIICGWMMLTQIQSSGTTAYYFYKYLIAVEMIAWALVPAAIFALLLPVSGILVRRVSPVLAVTLGISALAATQFFGFSISVFKDVGLAPTAYPTVQSAQQAQQILQVTPTVERLLASGHLGESRDAVYVSAGSEIYRELASRWQLAMGGNLTLRHMDMEKQLGEIGQDNPSSSGIISDVLTKNPSLYIILNPELYDQIHGTLANSDFENHLLRLN